MENSKIKRFYIMPEVWVTVTQSQVFNWIKLVNEKGISTDCISIASTKHNTDIVNEFEKSLSGNFIQLKARSLVINDIYLALNLIKYYRKNSKKYEKIIFQTRVSSIGFTFAVLRVLLPKAKFIFESRAAANEERVHVGEGKKVTLKAKIKNSFFRKSEKLMMKKSHKIFCVSNSLKRYYLNKYHLSENKFSVFPGAADLELFFYDEKLRNTTREELNINTEEILIVYSGRLEMKWEIPDKIFSFFKNLNDKNQKFKLLLITPDIELANNLINEYKFEDIVFVKEVKLYEVNKYLNAADVGLLLREDILMNNVASPTKFAEYLMAGLPVIISHGIHDFAQDIVNTGFGVVVSGLDEITSDEYKQLQESLAIDKVQIETWGSQQLSKETFIDRYVSVLSEV